VPAATSIVIPWHRRFAARAPRWLRGLLLRFEARIDREIGAFARSLAPRARVLDAGAGEGRHRTRFAHCRYAGVDLAVGDSDWDYSRLHARADLAALPFADGAFDATLNVVVLEHVPDPEAVLGEIARTLAPGGRLLLIVPQEWGMHQMPRDYFRYTRYGLEALLQRAGFQSVQIAPAGGFFTLLGRRLLDSALFFNHGPRWLVFPFWSLVVGPTGVLLPFLDFLDRDKLTTLGWICTATR